VTGILCVACSFFFTNTSLGWRLVGGFPGLLGAVQVALSCIVMVESPAWLIEKGRIEEASKVLARLFGEQYVTLALTWYQPSSSTNIAPPSVIVDDITEEDAKKVLPTSFANGPQGIKLLFSRMYLHQICVGTGIAMMQQFTGVNAIFYYSSSIFRHAGVEDDRIGGVIINIFSVLPTFGVLWIIKKYPKRKILLTGTTAMFLIALGLTIAMVTRVQVLSIIFTAMYVAAFSMSTGPLTWPLIAELFPDHVRSRAMAVASCSNWISNLIIGISFPLIANALGSYGFLPFMIALIISFIFIYTSIPETNGKTTDEIQAFFQRTTEESVA
jgi:MFS family permease